MDNVGSETTRDDDDGRFIHVDDLREARLKSV